MWMRVVEADHVEPFGACVSQRPQVVDGIEQVPVGICAEIPGANCPQDGIARTHEQAAALAWPSLCGMRPDGVEHRPCEGHTVSTTIAMPMPPPMHSDATP